jgi:hypothetical protein
MPLITTLLEFMLPTRTQIPRKNGPKRCYGQTARVGSNLIQLNIL